MFHWICPECGREIPPAVKECAVCDPQVSANSALSESSKPSVNRPSKSAEAIAPTPVAAAAPASIEVPKEPLPEPPEPAVAEALTSPETLAAAAPDATAKPIAAEVPKEEVEPKLIPDPVLLREIGAWLEP